MIQSHGTKSHMLGCKLYNGTSKTKQLIPVHLDLQNLRPSMCDFAQCDRIVQRAYWHVQQTQQSYTLVDIFYYRNNKIFFHCTLILLQNDH